MKKSYDPAEIARQIEKVISNDLNKLPEKYTNEEIIDPENADDANTSKQKVYIADPSMDISAALDVSGLSDEDIREIAVNAYRSNKVKSGKIAEGSRDLTEEGMDPSGSYNSGKTKFADGLNNFEEAVKIILGKGNEFLNDVGDLALDFANSLSDNGVNNSKLGSVLIGILKVISDGLSDYKDGVEGTAFGSSMELSWQGSTTKSFLNYFQQKNKATTAESRYIKFLSSTPLDSGEERTSLYGTMMLGAPFSFNEYSDPTNRTLINSLIKDGKFVTFTPGMPQFNGTSYTTEASNNILEQTKDPNSMYNYLKRNGLDKYFADRDKRYYTFKTDYAAYFAYLETMLNIIWVKLGLGTEGQTLNLFTFFKIMGDASEGGIRPDRFEELIEKYNSSIGFFTNTNGALSESIDSATAGFGDELSERANANAREYQKINFITGMGTGSAGQNLTRKMAVGVSSYRQLKDLFGDTYSKTINAASLVGSAKPGIKKIAAIAKVPLAAISDTNTFLTTQDIGAVMQSFATSNGMMVAYPDLWTNSTYSKNITSIGDYAFYGCSGLTSITIGDSVASIGDSAFNKCSSLQSITLPFVGGNKSATSASASTLFGYIFGTNSYDGGTETEQHYGAGAADYSTYYIPSSLKSLTITGGNILYGAFYNCSNLTNIIILDNVTSIGHHAFRNCSGLTYIGFKGTVSQWKYIEKAIDWKSNAPAIAVHCTDGVDPPITVVDISINSGQPFTFNMSGSKEWGDGTIDDATTHEYAAAGEYRIICNGTAIGPFSSTGLFGQDSSNRNDTVENIIIGEENITKIGSNAFYNCIKLTSVTIGNSVTSIGNNVFKGCTGLTSITIPDSVTSIGSDTFRDCTGLTSVTIGNSVTSIGSYAFAGCTGLTSMTTPNSMTRIGLGAFYNCSGLTSVTIGNGVTDIGSDTFHGCAGLTSITIPDSVASIGSDTFYDCTGLTSVTIGNSVTSIGDNVFSRCSSLTSITIPNSVTSIGERIANNK